MMEKNKAPRKNKSKSGLSKTIAWLHLWPSLVSALILILICLTGTIIVYCDEVIDFANKEVLYVAQVKQERVPVETLIKNVRRSFPERKRPGYLVFYRDPARSVKVHSYDAVTGLHFIYMDPYTGKILKDDRTANFFFIMAHLHSTLLIHVTGEWIIDIATVIFLLELITGLVLWWPLKWTKTTRNQSFKIKWKARSKRLNYDLHNVLGFYSLSIVLVLTLTGLIIAFKPLAKSTIKLFSGEQNPKWEKQMPAFIPERQPFEVNEVLKRYFALQPWAEAAMVMTYKLDTIGYVRLTLARHVGLKSQDGHYTRFVDRYSGRELNLPAKMTRADAIENTYWSLHMGTWLGWFGKLVTFTGGLIATSLPVTGFYIWWGRRK